MTPTVEQKYREQVIPALKEKFGYDNPMRVPRVKKVSVNMGLGAAIQNPKVIEAAQKEMSLITGQRPVVTRARKSISTFKLREGMAIGCMVTLRRARMYEFLDRLMNIALPRVRDFKGVSPKGFDGRGNYTLGLREQVIFPEVDYDTIERVTGMNISIVTSSETDEEARELLRLLGMPFRQ